MTRPIRTRADVEILADFLRIVFAIFEAEDGAAGHDFHVGKLRERADEAFGETVGEIFVVGVGGGVDERQHGDGSDFLRRGAAVQEVIAAPMASASAAADGAADPEFSRCAGRRSGGHVG